MNYDFQPVRKKKLWRRQAESKITKVSCPTERCLHIPSRPWHCIRRVQIRACLQIMISPLFSHKVIHRVCTGFYFDILDVYISHHFTTCSPCTSQYLWESPILPYLTSPLRSPGPPALPVTRSRRTGKYQLPWGPPTEVSQVDFSVGGHGIERCNWIGTHGDKDFSCVMPRNLAIFLGEMVEMLPHQ